MTGRIRVPEGYEPGAYPPFAVTVDIVVLTLLAGDLHIVTVRRDKDPYEGALALPGGFVHADETLDAAAARELSEETGVEAAPHLEQFGAYGEPSRDPRMRVVSIGFLAVLRDVGELVAGSDAREAMLLPVHEVLGERRKHELAFDHATILADGVEHARAQLETTSLATAFVGPEFTLADLRGVYEAAWEVELDPANFRRKVLANEMVTGTGEYSEPGPEGGKPAEYFRAAPLLRSSVAMPLEAPIRRPRRPKS